MAVTISKLNEFVLTIPSGNLVVRLAYNSNDDVEYVGYAPPGTTNEASAWRITRFYYDGSLMSGQRYADGNHSFDNSWIDRNTLTYA